MSAATATWEYGGPDGFIKLPSGNWVRLREIAAVTASSEPRLRRTHSDVVLVSGQTISAGQATPSGLAKLIGKAFS